jgi:hypothetical protein
MARKQPPFPPEASTKPDHKKARRAGASSVPSARGNTALKRRPASEAPTLPPPPPRDDDEDTPRSSSKAPGKSREGGQGKVSAVRPKARTSIPAATVDEVTADMRKDPRRDDD